MLFEVKNVALAVRFDTAFDYLKDMTKLPEWTNAFGGVKKDGTALMRTPEGEINVQLDVNVDHKNGVIDTKMTFPDGNVGTAYSRLIALSEDSCAYSFLLTPPPVALEKLEGALSAQAEILERELQTLKAKLEG
jgi:hypothetical protein